MLQVQSQQSKIWVGLAAAVVCSVALVGCGGGESTDNSGGISSAGSGTGAPQYQMGTGGPATGVGTGTGMPGAPGVGQPGPGQQPAAQVAGTPAPGWRKDPFRPWFNTTPPPPNVLTFAEPVRIAMGGTTLPEVQPGVEIQEVPTRRVAGILNGNGVYALLDGGPSGPEVVKPGQLLDDGYRVVMIDANSVTLQKKIASQTYTQVVPLTDAGSAPPPMGGAPGGRMGPGGGMTPGGIGPAGVGGAPGLGGPGFGRPRGGGGPGLPGAGLLSPGGS